MAVEFSVLLAFNSGSTPKNWPCPAINIQALNGKAESKTESGRRIAIALGGQIMQPVAGKALLG